MPRSPFCFCFLFRSFARARAVCVCARALCNRCKSAAYLSVIGHTLAHIYRSLDIHWQAHAHSSTGQCIPTVHTNHARNVDQQMHGFLAS